MVDHAASAECAYPDASTPGTRVVRCLSWLFMLLAVLHLYCNRYCNQGDTP